MNRKIGAHDSCPDLPMTVFRRVIHGKVCSLKQVLAWDVSLSIRQVWVRMGSVGLSARRVGEGLAWSVGVVKGGQV
jgi:hypothetical protein